jgi:cell shape-determining protein MreC
VDGSKYAELCVKVEDNRNAIALLSEENAALKAEIARCQGKITEYRQMKRKYDRLSESLSQIADSGSRSGRRRTPQKAPE